MRMTAHAVIALLAAALPAAAQEPFSSERPSFSSSPYSLGVGLWQLEGGVQYARVDSGIDAWSLPNALLRYGAGERAEIQLGWTGFSRIDFGGSNVDGLTDASLGVKWQLTDDGVATPFGLFAGVSLPVGGDDLSSDEIDPSIGFFWAHEGRVSLFGTVLVSESGDDTSIGNAVGINLSLGSACRQCGAFIEYVGIHPEDGGPQHTLGGGITWMRQDNLQFDVNAGFGLNDRAADGFFGLGAAYRFR